MEDYYERYIDKEQIINNACACIDANRSSKLQSEISQIKDVVSKLTISENWQDIVGDAFSNVIALCVSTLGQIEDSISSQFASSENIYMLIKTQLSRLKMINQLYQSHYLKKPHEPRGNNTTQEEINDYKKKFKAWKEKLDNYKTQCISLSDEIDNNFNSLNNINGMTVESNNNISLPSLKTSMDEFKKAISSLGKFVFSNASGVYGTIVSGLDGRTYKIYNQKEINGWGGFCNRAAAASIASGFINNGLDPLEEANKVSAYNPNIGYNQEATSDYFKRFNCRAKVNKVNCPYDNVRSDIISALKNGDKVMFDFDESNSRKTGASEQKWLSKRHWVAALDFKTVDGKDYIFISDSGHDGSTKDYYGLGEGWYSVDEFKGMHVANVTTISPPAKPTVASITSSTQIQSNNNNQYIMNSSQTVSGTDIEAAVYQAVKDEGYNDAVAAALIANVDAESNFETSASGDRGSSYGLYQWHNNRKTNFLNYCKENNLDSTDPYVQTKYALYEVKNNPEYKKVYDTITSVPDNREGYIEASKRWTTDFEIPTNKNAKANSRAINGEKYYNNIVQFNNNYGEKI